MRKEILLVLLLTITFNSLCSQVNKGDSPFYEKMRTLPLEEREKLIYDEIMSGNVPDYMKGFVKISYKDRDANHKTHRVTLFVKPDYLTVGDGKSAFIIPMTPATAQKIADSSGCSLPTPKIVDIIYKKSILKVEPFNYIPRGDRNETPDIFYDHSRVIFAQIKAAGYKPGVFIAGSKKDIVISSKLQDSLRPGHVIIYGWHRLDGTPIQPVYNGHLGRYVDYSHGVRLICDTIKIDGKKYNYRDVLRDTLLYTLLSNEDKPLVITSYSY